MHSNCRIQSHEREVYVTILKISEFQIVGGYDESRDIKNPNEFLYNF